MEIQWVFRFPLLKNIAFPLIFLDFYAKSKKTLGNTMVLYYQMRKIQKKKSIGFFWILNKNPTKEIQKSKNPKLSEIFLKVLVFWIFGFLDFAENPKIQKPKNPKITEILRKVLDFGIFGFWDFLNIVC